MPTAFVSTEGVTPKVCATLRAPVNCDLKISAKEFDALVEGALRRIPPRFRSRLENVAIVVEPEPPERNLLGLYQGHPLTTRHVGAGFQLPDRITIYQGPHERASRNRAQLEEMVGETLWHEIAHYFGMDENQVRRAERRRAMSVQRAPRRTIRSRRAARGAEAPGMLRCYVTDRHSTSSLLDSIARNLEDGVTWIQIREKDLPTREMFELVKGALALPNPHGTKIIVNGRMDVALAAGAHGLHLPSGSIAADRWRAIAAHRETAAEFLIGVSCHTIDEAREAESAGADYVLFGPVFAPLSKVSDLAPRGIEGLREAARAVRIPVLALGGITKENAAECVAAGAAGVAGISMFQNGGAGVIT